MDNKRFFTNPRNRVLLATLCVLLWGSAYPAVKTGYQLFAIPTDDLASKFVFAGVRFFLAGLLVLGLSLVLRRSLVIPNWRVLRQIAVYGLTYTTIQYAFFYVGLAYTTGTNGSIMNSTMTFFSVLIAHAVYPNDRLTPRRLTGVLAGFAGVVASLYSKGSFLSGFSIKGDGLLLVSSLLLAAASIYGKQITAHLDSMVITGYQLSLGGLLLAIIGWLANGHLRVVTVSGPVPGHLAIASWPALILLLYMAVLSAVAFTIWTALLKYNPVGSVTVFNFLIPIFGTLLSGLFLNESIWQVKYLVALALVGLGIWLVNRGAKAPR